ncbi:hypothetical protein [uncultured Phycicoccus sp.]|uniref:hypothetical protein n=1 Tax=uncultured Phycicoccus sp. TaxID=661422 RepID=UPI00262CA859|nr:hypothetical protein [uncultured Phycicoccus sp.]
MLIRDEGAGVPPLPGDAGPFERMLHDIYGFSTPLVRMSAEDWRKVSDAVTTLSAEVRSVVAALQGADEPWEGPAADSAYATLHALATALDARATEIADVRTGLEHAAAAADSARLRYATDVRSVSTDVDPEAYRPAGGGPFNVTGYEAAIEGRREQREAKAKAVLDDFSTDMGQAAKQLPVEARDDSVTITPTSGRPRSGGGHTPGSANGAAYQPPSGGVRYSGSQTGFALGPGADGGSGGGAGGGPGGGGTTGGDGSDPGHGVQLDGPTGGTTAPTTGGSTGWAGTSAQGPATGGSGLGGAGAAGAGGLLSGGAAMLGRGAFGRGGPLGGAGRPGPVIAGSTGAAARGSAAGGGARSGTAGAARPVVAPGSQGAVRGGQGAGGVKGARTGGRYGVPRLGESGSGRGAVVAGSAAGGRGRGAKDTDAARDVDSLTHEDEETWFEGEDDATPPVWG